MAIQDPTAWKDDLAFYMTEEAVEGQVSAVEPLLETGSKRATAAWVAVTGTLGGAFGAVTTNSSIRRPITFAIYVVLAALLLRGLHPLTVHLLGRGTAWLAMFAFFWTSLLGLGVALVSGIDSRWIAYPLSLGVGAFIGMMYGAFPPDVARKDDPWMLSFVFAPIGAFAATFFLRHVNPLGAIGPDAAGGAIAAGVLMVPMALLLVKLWDEAQSLADLGQLYLHNDAFAPRAAAHLDRALALDPKNARYHTLRAIAFARMDQPERARADWETASALAPQDPEPHVQRGVDDMRRGDLAAAATAFELALAKAPNHARAHAYLGEVREMQGETERAFYHYDKAVTLAPDDAKVRCDRGSAFLRRGEPERALADAKRATRLRHHFGPAHATLGHALLALGRTKEAADSFHEALEHGLEPRVSEDVLRALESLGAAEDEPEVPEDEA